MICIGCAERLEAPVCAACRAGLREGPRFLLDGELLVSAAFHHHGVARRIVHRLKYDGIRAAADVLAGAMATRLPATATALVPVPRAIVRRVRFGIDPSVELARALQRITGTPVVPVLRPALYWQRHATRRPSGRAPARFDVVRAVPSGAVLIDDVVTSGATVRAAGRAILRTGSGDVRMVLAATSPGTAPRPAGEPHERRNPRFAGAAGSASVRDRILLPRCPRTGRVEQRDEQGDPPDQETLCQDTVRRDSRSGHRPGRRMLVPAGYPHLQLPVSARARGSGRSWRSREEPQWTFVCMARAFRSRPSSVSSPRTR